MRLVIFDCDGTIVDSQHGIFAAMALAFERHGLPVPARQRVLEVVGLSLPEAFRVVAHDQPPAVQASLAEAYRSDFPRARALAGHRDHLFLGLGTAIEALSRRDDIVLGIATGKSRRGVARLLDQEGWHGRFVTIQTADDHPSKPHPSMIYSALAETDVPVHRAVMIGDTTFDIEMALNAGVGALGVAWGYHPRDRLTAAGAHAIVEEADALLAAIDARFALQEGAAPMSDGRGGGGDRPQVGALGGRSLPKRFYKAATVAVLADREGRTGFAPCLDGRPLRTPGKVPVTVASRALAEAIAAEWAAQGTHVDPATMPLTKLVNSALDGVVGKELAVAADIAAFAASDLVCYRADEPAELVARQAAVWDGVIVFAEQRLGVRFKCASGLMPVEQSPNVVLALEARLRGLDPIMLAALHVITTLTGSALLALAVYEGHMTTEAAWAAAHVDEDWQIERWGSDAEAARRRERHWADMAAAARALDLVRRSSE